MDRITQFILSACSFLFILGSMSCGETVPQPADSEIWSSVDAVTALREVEMLRIMVDIEARNDPGVFKNGNFKIDGMFCNNSMITVSTQGANTIMEIDFKSGTTCLDGRLRTGKINVSFDGPWSASGTNARITQSNYTTNGWPMTIDMSVSYAGDNANNEKVYQNDITAGAIAFPEGACTFSGVTSIKWTEGIATESVLNDNKYLINATLSGVSRYSRLFSMMTDQDVMIKSSCPNIVEGVVTVVPDGGPNRQLTFGNGDELCENNVIFAIGEWFTDIVVP